MTDASQISKNPGATRSVGSYPGAAVGPNVVGLTLNYPGPLALHRLQSMGWRVTKVEGPAGDPLQHHFPTLYDRLREGSSVRVLDLLQTSALAEFKELLKSADCFLTSARSQSLDQMGCSAGQLAKEFPNLKVVQLIGDEADESLPTHDLNALFASGLASVAQFPNALYVDTLAAEQLVSSCLSVQNLKGFSWSKVSLQSCANQLAWPLEAGLTVPEGLLGGQNPFYSIYRCSDGQVAVACVEPKFTKKFCEALAVSPQISRSDLQAVIEKISVVDLQDRLSHLPVTMRGKDG